jgi:hypothetical protein
LFRETEFRGVVADIGFKVIIVFVGIITAVEVTIFYCHSFFGGISVRFFVKQLMGEEDFRRWVGGER